MARKMNSNQQFSNSIIKFLVKAVKEENLSALMSYLPQSVILFLLGEYVPLHEGDVFESEHYKKAKVDSVNMLTGEYYISYDYTDRRFFKTEEEAKVFTESGKTGGWDTYKDCKREDYQYEGIRLSRQSTTVSWPI